MNRIVVVSLLVMLSASAASRPLPRSVESLAAAERAFAADGLREGVQKSFLAHFAVDSIVLHPFAVSGTKFYRAHPDRPGTRLHWAPQYLAVSAAGDLGLSSGPWRFEAERDGKASVAYGHFFSIWRRNGKGAWQVLFDHGIGHADSPDTVERTALVALDDVHGVSNPDRGRRRSLLLAADDALRTRLDRDPRGGYAGAARRDTLWVREGAVPQRSALPPSTAEAGVCGCGPLETLGLSTSGDLAYTIGGRDSERAKGVYARVWRYDAEAGWTLLADLTAAVK